MLSNETLPAILPDASADEMPSPKRFKKPLASPEPRMRTVAFRNDFGEIARLEGFRVWRDFVDTKGGSS